MTDSSSCLDADSDQTLHTKKSKLLIYNQHISQDSEEEEEDSFARVGKPQIKAFGRLSSEDTSSYDLAKSDQNQKEVEFLSNIMRKQIGYTLEDTTEIQEKSIKKARGASQEVTQKTLELEKRIDAIQQAFIRNMKDKWGEADVIPEDKAE